MGDIPGGQFIIPREVIKAVVNNYYDMAEETIGESTFCCGGGGGLLTDDLLEIRVKGALPRMEALNNVVQEHTGQFPGVDLRDLQGAVQQGSPLLRFRYEHGGWRSPIGEYGHPVGK